MQGGELHNAAGHRHRFHDRVRRDPSGTTHALVNVQQFGLDLLRGIFVGNGPAGRPGGGAELPLLGNAVHLHHQAIHFAHRIAPMLLPVGNLLMHLVNGFHQLGVVAHGQAPRGQRLVGMVLGCGGEPFGGPNAVAEHAQFPAAHCLHVFLPQRARRGVTGVSKGLTAILLALLVDLGEILDCDKHLTAHL